MQTGVEKIEIVQIHGDESIINMPDDSWLCNSHPVTLRVKTTICGENASGLKVSLNLAPLFYNGAKLPRIEVQILAGLIPAGENMLVTEIPVKNPRLWFPEELGDRNIYELIVTVKERGALGGGEAAKKINEMKPLCEERFNIGLCNACEVPGESGKYRVNGYDFKPDESAYENCDAFISECVRLHIL